MAPKSRIRYTTSDVDFSSSASQTGSLLLSLPAELKILIYEFIAKDTKLTWHRRRGPRYHPSGYYPYDFDGKPEAPAFILACKEMHQEAIPILYSSTTFTFRSNIAFNNWLNTISDENLASAKTGTVHATRSHQQSSISQVTLELRMRAKTHKKQALLQAKADRAAKRQLLLDAKTEQASKNKKRRTNEV